MKKQWIRPKRADGDEKFVRVQANLGKVHSEALGRFSKMYNLPISRLIAIAIDNELNDSDAPFKINLSLPEGYIEYAFAEQASMIVTFLKTQTVGMSLDMLYVLRHDIGISDRETFLGAFKECLEKNVIEAVKAPNSVKYVQDTLLYRVVTGRPVPAEKKELDREARRERYLKLKAEFENEG